MSDGKRMASGLRERFADGAEDKLGKALADLIENPLVSGTIGRAFDARDRAAQAQELALSALNLPTAADIERLTRRLRSVSQRLEGIEDGVHRLNRALSDGGIDTRLSAVEDQLKTLSGKLAPKGNSAATPKAAAASKAAKATPKRTGTTPKRTATAKRAAGSRSARASKIDKSA